MPSRESASMNWVSTGLSSRLIFGWIYGSIEQIYVVREVKSLVKKRD